MMVARTHIQMPVAFLLRLLARLALARALSRRGAPVPWQTPGQPGGMPPGAPPPSGMPQGPAGMVTRWVAARLGGAVDVARIVLHLVTLFAFLAAAGTLLTAGTTLTTLGPRWVGIALLVLAALAALVAGLEFRTTLRLRRIWRRRQAAARLRQVQQ